MALLWLAPGMTFLYQNPLAITQGPVHVLRIPFAREAPYEAKVEFIAPRSGWYDIYIRTLASQPVADTVVSKEAAIHTRDRDQIYLYEGEKYQSLTRLKRPTYTELAARPTLVIEYLEADPRREFLETMRRLTIGTFLLFCSLIPISAEARRLKRSLGE